MKQFVLPENKPAIFLLPIIILAILFWKAVAITVLLVAALFVVVCIAVVEIKHSIEWQITGKEVHIG